MWAERLKSASIIRTASATQTRSALQSRTAFLRTPFARMGELGCRPDKYELNGQCDASAHGWRPLLRLC